MRSEAVVPVFDSPTVVMLIVVTSISSLVHLYSISYMSEDPHSPRFMCYLSIPTFFMPMLVTGDNSLQLFLGWEGVGLASYLLIHFWFTRLQADKAAIKAIDQETSKQICSAGLIRSSVPRASINPESQAALSLSDFWLSDHTRNYVSTYHIFAPARFQ